MQPQSDGENDSDLMIGKTKIRERVARFRHVENARASQQARAPLPMRAVSTVETGEELLS
jgi:hypothetical protein